MKQDVDYNATDLDQPLIALHDLNEDKLSEKEMIKKKKKVKTKSDEKKKKKAKARRKSSHGDLTDEDDDESFVEEIKQLPKRNRQAPRRYVCTVFVSTHRSLRHLI